MREFLKTSLTEYQLVSNNVNYLYEQYNQIQQFLSSRFPSPFQKLLAQPNLINTDLVWYSPVEGELKPLASLSEAEQRKMLITYNARRYEIEQICNELSTSSDVDQRYWADILNSVFNPDHLLLFSNGLDLVFVWGIKTHKQKDYSLPLELFKSSILIIDPKVVSGDVQAGEQEPLIHAFPDNESSETEENLDFIDNSNTDLMDSDEIEATSEENTNETEGSSSPQEQGQEQKSEPEKEPIDKDGKSSPIKTKHWFYRGLDRFEIFASKFWWLLLILFIVLILLLLRTCDETPNSENLSEVEIEERYDEIMPEIPRKRIIPIDTTDFKEDDETGGVIVGGLLNLALVDKKEKFKRMAVELKHIFPETEYKIVYFDEETNRLQLSFPEEKEKQTKASIKSKLKDYDPLVWNEAVFTGSKKTNDPFMKDPEKSWYFNAINTPKAWDISMGDTSVRVAIIDDGFDLNHPEFKGKNIINPYNVTTDNTKIFGNDHIKHGTHVAGLALANANNNSGSSGIAPKCSFMPIQIGSGEEYFTMTDIVDGVLYALNHGADVINMSLGKYFGEELKSKSPGELENIISNYGKDEEAFWKELFHMAEKSNTLIVLAAGNEDLPIGLDPMQRSDEVLKVVALDPSLKKASFSNYCKGCLSKNTFISAPGVDIFSSVPFGKYESMDGTSMAAPIVTGAVALIKSVKPKLQNKEIMKLLRKTAKTVPDRSIPSFLQIDKALEYIN